jgi:hypothetical protein
MNFVPCLKRPLVKQSAVRLRVIFSIAVRLPLA